MHRWNKTYNTKRWIRHDDNVLLTEPKDDLCQWIEKLSVSLTWSETLFIIFIIDIITDENLDNERQYLLELPISGTHRNHYLLFAVLYCNSQKSKKEGKGHICLVP